MKLTIVFLTAGFLNVSAKSVSQNITFFGQNVPLQTAFDAVERQTGFVFMYAKPVLNSSKPVTIAVENMSLNKFLTEIFKSQPLEYTIRGKNIFILTKSSTVDPSWQQEAFSDLLLAPIRGRVLDERGQPLVGASVMIKNTKNSVVTDGQGAFSLNGNEGNILLISFIGYETRAVTVTSSMISSSDNLVITLKTSITKLEDVQVVVNTGYQKIPKERATGSFGFVNNEELNRKAGVDILSRLEGVTTGVFFDRRETPISTNTVATNSLMIRGLNTLTTTMKAPLVVVDDFQYDGDIKNINPNDIENITILKDAAAASIYGAKAGNGVIVITTKRGQYNRHNKISFNTNTQLIERPDLFKYPKMTPSEFIDLEIFLFGKNFFNSDISNARYPSLTPVVEILQKRKLNQITSSDSATQIDQLRKNDVRNDFEKYIYQTGVNSQYALNFNGGGDNFSYSLSGGYDKSLSSLNGDQFNRFTLRSNNSFTPFRNAEVTLGVAYTNSTTDNNSPGHIGGSAYEYRSGKKMYPYAQLADQSGNVLAIAKDYRAGYTDTAGAGKLLDWKYRPLDELKFADNSTRLQDILLNLGVSYRLASFVTVQASYQFQQSNIETRKLFSEKTYFTRNLINLYTRIQSGSVINAIPPGGILDLDNVLMKSQQGRVQLNFNQNWNNVHQITGFIGGEIREAKSSLNISRVYGFDENTFSNSKVDYITSFAQYGNRGTTVIPERSGTSLTTDHFVSAYGNLAYTYKDKYTFSTSARKDAANIFGVRTNNRWKPLWTVGGAWNVHNESFYKSQWVPYLRLRLTYGYQGNVNNTISPLTILGYIQANNPGNVINQQSAGITSTANPDLGWETLRQTNLGIDLKIRDRAILTVDAFYKKSNNFIWAAPTDPSTGITNVKKNSASMIGKGIEISLNTQLIKAAFQWSNEIGVSFISNEVINYADAETQDKSRLAQSVVPSQGLNITGVRKTKPYSIFSYAFAGLDPVNGDPMGYLGKTVSKNYSAIFNEQYDTASIIYHGSAIPTTFGFFNNIFRYKGFSLLVNINYRFNYYFRKSAISYSALVTNSITHPDYSKRWQKPGDENFTNVPSFIYPVPNARRDNFYTYSSINVLKGDNIRLQNIRLSYNWNNSNRKGNPVKGFQIYGNVENLGILWRANKAGLDPDYDILSAAYPIPKIFTIGAKLDF